MQANKLSSDQLPSLHFIYFTTTDMYTSNDNLQMDSLVTYIFCGLTVQRNRGT